MHRRPRWINEAEMLVASDMLSGEMHDGLFQPMACGQPPS